MAGNAESAKKRTKTILAKNPNFFREIGRKGGQAKVKKGFAVAGQPKKEKG